MDAGGVTTAYLFGSAARDELRVDSDIDVGVLLAEGVAGTDACLAIEERIERALGRRAQVVDLSRAPADLVQRVLRDAVLLLDRDPTIRVRFEIGRRNEWYDLQPLLREYRRARGAA
jgi:predicted nucleotidyltransferase